MKTNLEYQIQYKLKTMKTMTQFMKTQMAQPKERETEDDMSEKMIASELKKFPENLKFHRKHDINQVIYNYKLNQYNTMTPNSNWFPSCCCITKLGFWSTFAQPINGKWFQPL